MYLKIFNNNEFVLTPYQQNLLRTKFYEISEVTLDVVEKGDYDSIPVRNKRGRILCRIDCVNDQLL